MGDAPDTQVEAQVVAAKNWLFGSDGAGATEALLRRYRASLARAGEHLALDELRSVALAKFWEHVQRCGPVADFQPAGYLSVIMRNHLHDIHRGRRSTGTDVVSIDDERNTKVVQPALAVAATEAGIGIGDVPVDWRNAIEVIDEPEWTRAAALAYLALVAYPNLVPDDVELPRPDNGASTEETARWHALWFAGQRTRHFPVDGQPQTTAIRKSRSRAGIAVRTVVARAVTASMVPGTGG